MWLFNLTVNVNMLILSGRCGNLKRRLNNPRTRLLSLTLRRWLVRAILAKLRRVRTSRCVVVLLLQTLSTCRLINRERLC